MNSDEKKLSTYSTLVFDCDGVLLDSNKVKTEAFFQAALPYGREAAQALADYHIENGGISRYKKFSYFLKHIIINPRQGPGLDALLDSYAANVKKGLLTCQVANGLHELRKKTPRARWMIVSGGDQGELRETFRARGLADLFDGGIFGSPDIKEDILKREIDNENLIPPALFLGDSKYDFKAANEAKIDFLFMSKWTEVVNWQEWCAANRIKTSESIYSLSLSS